MSEIDAVAANPPQETATSEPSVPFWEKMDNAQAEETPEPAAEAETTEAPDTEAQASDEIQAEPEVEEDADDYLPTEQEKVFPDEVLAKYAKRYGRTMEQLQADPQLRQLILDKINSDVLIRQQMQAQQEQQEAEGEEPTPAEANQPAAPTPQDRTQWLEQVVSTSLDPKAVDQMGRDFLVACGVDPESPDSEAVLGNSGKVGTVLAKGALDLFTTIAPQMQMQMLEAAMPGITEMYQRNLYALQWDRATSSEEFKDANLPKYGTPEFQTAVKAAAAKFPGFAQMVFTDAKGNPLPAHQQIEKQYAFLAAHMTGQTVTPKEVQAAINKGKQTVKDADRSRAAGKALGAGQSKRQFAQAAPREDFQSWIADYNASQRSTPLKG